MVRMPSLQITALAPEMCVFDVTGVKEGERVYGGEVLHV